MKASSNDIFFKSFNFVFFLGNLILVHSRSYNGALEERASIGMSATSLLLKFNINFLVSVVLPMTTKSKSHLSNIFLRNFLFRLLGL